METRGDIDHGTCESLDDALSGAIESGSSVVLLDLHKVTYIDSGGLSVLLSAVRQLRDKGWLGAIGPNANTRRLLEIVGLMVDPCFRVFETREEAEAALLEEQTV